MASTVVCKKNLTGRDRKAEVIEEDPPELSTVGAVTQTTLIAGYPSDIDSITRV